MSTTRTEAARPASRHSTSDAWAGDIDTRRRAIQHIDGGVQGFGGAGRRNLPVPQVAREPVHAVPPRRRESSVPGQCKGRRVDNARPSVVAPEYGGDGFGSWSVSDIGYGRFLCDIFDVWVKTDVGRYFVGMFDATLASYCGVTPGTCSFCETCGSNAVVEHNGDVYACDHFVYPEYLLGNVSSSSLRTMMQSDKAVSFGIAKRNSLPSQCRRCEWVHLCNGECPKHRFSKTKTGEEGLNSLCAGLQMFYKHTEPYMKNAGTASAAAPRIRYNVYVTSLSEQALVKQRHHGVHCRAVHDEADVYVRGSLGDHIYLVVSQRGESLL